LDAGRLGNVYHGVMQALYLGDKAMDPSFPLDRDSIRESIRNGSLVPLAEVTEAYISGWLKRKQEIKDRIRSLIREQLHSQEVTGRNLILENVILQYVLKTLERDRSLMKEEGTDRFRVLGLEMAKSWEFDGYKFFGYIDRMDSFSPDTVRIVDYTTGKVTDKDVRIDSGNAVSVAEQLFGPDNRNRPKIALQLFLYDMYVADQPEVEGRRVVNAIYPAGKLFTDDIKTADLCPEFCEEVKQRLHGLLAEMADPDEPIRRTQDRDTCQLCDFKIICGR
ncbi:MAG: PD-(D/E)XK nuclease family protein, partial [Bacteroidales bacterium]|nr:PD-(D/E)XK nuclease family protein [Bacteroidales bacterium]